MFNNNDDSCKYANLKIALTKKKEKLIKIFKKKSGVSPPSLLISNLATKLNYLL